MRPFASRGAWILAAALSAGLSGCGKQGTLEKAGKKADEALQKAGQSAKEAADRMAATAAAAGSQAAETADRVGHEVKEGARKVGDVVVETSGNVQREVKRGNPLPAPTPTRPAGSSPRKPIKY
ncbi:MAG TPA: hypothetical protein VL084_07275 [Thermoanaerobaculia bacterium]|nr:hypothetical protein [Thermoanaerobaculia bacterium]